MEYPTIFRCQSGGKMFRVVEVSDPIAPYGYYYYVYAGRKRFKNNPFPTAYAAAECIMRACLDIWTGVLEENTL